MIFLLYTFCTCLYALDANIPFDFTSSGKIPARTVPYYTNYYSTIDRNMWEYVNTDQQSSTQDTPSMKTTLTYLEGYVVNLDGSTLSTGMITKTIVYDISVITGKVYPYVENGTTVFSQTKTTSEITDSHTIVTGSVVYPLVLSDTTLLTDLRLPTTESYSVLTGTVLFNMTSKAILLQSSIIFLTLLLVIINFV